MITRNLKQELAASEVARFEKRYSEQIGRQTALRDIPIKNFVDVDTGLLETKVSSLFMQGATDAAGFWPNLINVVQMRAPKDEVPIISPRDIAVRTGKMPRTEPQQSGGRIRKVELDATNDDKIRYVHLPIDIEDVKTRNFDYIEKTIVAGGAAFAKHILGQITSHYVSKAGNSQALSTDKYFVAVMKAIALNGTDGFGCTAIVIEQNDFVQAVTEETTGGTMPWLSNVALGSLPLGDNFAKGVASAGMAGLMFGQIPVFVVNNDSNLSGNVLCIDVPSAGAFGWAPGGQIELAQEVKRMQDLIDNKISAKYDFASPDDGSGKTNAVAKVTGA